jgi:hypothetical protein
VNDCGFKHGKLCISVISLFRRHNAGHATGLLASAITSMSYVMVRGWPS